MERSGGARRAFAGPDAGGPFPVWRHVALPWANRIIYKQAANGRIGPFPQAAVHLDDKSCASVRPVRSVVEERGCVVVMEAWQAPRRAPVIALSLVFTRPFIGATGPTTEALGR